MTHLDSSFEYRKGATRISWEHDSARYLLAKIMEELPDGDVDSWTKELLERAAEEGCERSIYLYFTVNHAAALMRGRHPRPSKLSREQMKAKMRTRLLDVLMPNGKPLRDCTGEECKRFGAVQENNGRWLQRLGEQVGERHVGEVFNEKQ